jgi:hypothetical protein
VGEGFGPGLPLSAASSPRRRAARHFSRWDEYSPSLLSKAPTSPGLLHLSAAARIFALYSAVNLEGTPKMRHGDKR